MKKLLKTLVIIIITAVISASIYTGIDSKKVSADTTYRYSYANISNNSLPCFRTISEASQYATTQYTSGAWIEFIYDGTLSGSMYDFVFDVFDGMMVHNGVSDQGDYLRYRVESYGYGYTTYTNASIYGGNVYRMYLRINTRTTSAQEAELDTAINNQLAAMNLNGKSSYEKICAIYSFITSNVTYDYENYYRSANTQDKMMYTAYKAMINRTAVCQGIAMLFYRMCLEVGVDCRVVVSTTHAWNIVQIGSYYYNVDATWDLGKTNYNYFLLPCAGQFAGTHHEYTDPVYNTYPMATTAYTADMNVGANLVNDSANAQVVAFVKRLYNVALGRGCDPTGLQNWVTEIVVNRTSGGSIAIGFLTSQEFLNKNLSNEQFVEVLYQVFFNRASDPSGKANWLQCLNNGMSRLDVIGNFINSVEWANCCMTYNIVSGGTAVANVTASESITAFATRLYTTALGRTADPSGLDYWATGLANRRISGTQAAYGFFFSQEFLNANYSNEEYVNRLYRTFLGREADPQGFDNWVQLLNNGASREEVFYGFANSIEFYGICSSYGITR